MSDALANLRAVLAVIHPCPGCGRPLSKNNWRRHLAHCGAGEYPWPEPEPVRPPPPEPPPRRGQPTPARDKATAAACQEFPGADDPLTTWLVAHRDLTIREQAQRLEVSERMVDKWRAALFASGALTPMDRKDALARARQGRPARAPKVRPEPRSRRAAEPGPRRSGRHLTPVDRLVREIRAATDEDERDALRGELVRAIYRRVKYRKKVQA